MLITYLKENQGKLLGINGLIVVKKFLLIR